MHTTSPQDTRHQACVISFILELLKYRVVKFSRRIPQRVTRCYTKSSIVLHPSQNIRMSLGVLPASQIPKLQVLRDPRLRHKSSTEVRVAEACNSISSIIKSLTSSYNAACHQHRSPRSSPRSLTHCIRQYYNPPTTGMGFKARRTVDPSSNPYVPPSHLQTTQDSNNLNKQSPTFVILPLHP